MAQQAQDSFYVTISLGDRQMRTRRKFQRSDLVSDLKQCIADEHGRRTGDITLIYRGRYLQDNGKTLGFYGINGMMHVYVSFKVCGGCFVNGTMVSVDATGNNKLKKIEEFQCGDSVLSYNLSSKEFEESIIKNILLFEVNTLVKIKFSDKSDDIVCTPTHPFWCNNKQMYCCIDNNAAQKIYNKLNDNNSNNNTIKFGELCIGDELLNDKLELVCISSIIFNKPTMNNNNVCVRTFSLNGKNNNFFANGKLVHNKRFL